MNGNEITAKWEDRFTGEMTGVSKQKQEAANMGYDGFLNLLMESRITQAS